MTKADLIAVIADKLKFPWTRAELLVDVVLDCMEQSMIRGEKIAIRATHPNYLYTRHRIWYGSKLDFGSVAHRRNCRQNSLHYSFDNFGQSQKSAVPEEPGAALT
jgi:hypothetical protein